MVNRAAVNVVAKDLCGKKQSPLSTCPGVIQLGISFLCVVKSVLIAMDAASSCTPTSSTTLTVISDDSHSDRGEMESQSSFNLHFSDS